MLRPQLNTCREQVSLDGMWEFRIQHADDQSAGWEKGFPMQHWMAVPSSFNDLLVEESERNHWGPVWYSRTFEVPHTWRGRRIMLWFGSANYQADVWLNGRHLGAHETGYTPFEFDLSEALSDGGNLLVVRVNTRLTRDTVPQGEIDLHEVVGWGANYPPGNFDFFTYSGLHRSVLLYATHPAHLDQVLIDSTVTENHAVVRTRLHVTGGDEVRLHLKETGQTMAQPAAAQMEACFQVAQPRLWDVGRPELYHLRIEVVHQGRVVDAYEQPFGIRTVDVKGEQVLLNGKPVYFKGFGKHEDFFLIGKGHSDAVVARDFQLLNWIGANSFRTSHYPYDETWLDMADRLGILIISESPAVTIVPDKATPKTLATHCAAQQEYMLRDYNHPSVVMWSIANEAHSHQDSARAYFQQVVATARAVDRKRPLMLVTCFGDRDQCLDLVDVIGLNCYPGWYWGGGVPFARTMAWFGDFLTQMRTHCGGRPMMMTEFGGDALPGVHNLPGELWTEEYQADLLREMIGVIRRTGFMCGEHVWSFADFRTGQNYTRAYGNHKGVFTRDRQPKRAAYALREIWRS